MKIFFAIIAVFILAFMNYYAYKRFISRTSFFSGKKWLKWVVFVIFLLEYLFFFDLGNNVFSPLVYNFLASLLGITFISFVVAIFYDLLTLPVGKFGKNRVLIKFFIDILMLLVLIGAIIWGFDNAKNTTVINQNIELGVEKPLTLVHVTDVHLGKTIKREFLENLIELINAQNPDIVVITGDFIDTKVTNLGDALEPLHNLKSTHGVFLVSGNHEYIHDWEQIKDFLKPYPITILENSHVEVSGLNLVGVNDLAASRFVSFGLPDLDKALEDSDEKLPRILLAHQPKFANFVNDEHKIDLMLSGHTHNGQIFPFGFLVLIDQPYLHGLYQHTPKSKVYVSSGAGYWGPPLRIFSRSEIIKFNIR